MTSSARSQRVAPPSEEGEVEEVIARRIARLRTARRMTLGQLAAVAGLSKGYLSKIENRRQTPPIGTLVRIASALGTDVSYFLREDAVEENELVSVVRVAERRSIVRGGTQFGYDYKSLAHKRRFKHMEPFVFSFPTVPGEKARFEHDGEEFLFVLSGQVEFEIGSATSSRTWVLEVGDCIYFDSSIPHRGRSLTEESTALVVVMNAGGAES